MTSSDRTTRNWFRNKNFPNDLDKICEVIFSKNPDYLEWEVDLRRAAEKLRLILSPKPLIAEPIRRPSFLSNMPSKLQYFVSREFELELLTEWLSPNKFLETPRVAIAHALSGVGKTALAVEFAHRTYGMFSNIYWCAANTRETLIMSLATIADCHPDIAIQDDNTAIKAAKIVHYLSKCLEPWLLIYDDVDKPNDLNDLIPYGNTSVMITSIFSDWSQFSNTIPLKVIQENHSVELLNRIAKRDDNIGASALAYALGYLPLAMNHAAVTCRRCHLSFKEYTKHYEDYLSVLPPGVDYERHVHATFSILLDKININNSTQDLLFFLCHCSPEPIPVIWIEDLFEKKNELINAMMCLDKISSIEKLKFI